MHYFLEGIIKKFSSLILAFFILVTPAMTQISEVATDDISDKIIITTEEVLLHESEYKRSSFYNLKIYNKDNVSYKLNSLSCDGDYEDKLKIKDLYTYYLKENDDEGYFPYTFAPHVITILGVVLPFPFLVPSLMCLCSIPEKEMFNTYVKEPIKSIILIPTNSLYKIKEGQRNRKIRKALKKYYKMNDTIDYKEIHEFIIEPNTELQIPIATQHFSIWLENIETHKEYRFYDGLIWNK